MRGSWVVASNSDSALAMASKPVQIIKVVKPAAGQTEKFYASFDGPVKIDFTAIANQKATYFHDSKSQSLRVVFIDGAQVIIEPVFDFGRRNAEFRFRDGAGPGPGWRGIRVTISDRSERVADLTDGSLGCGAEVDDRPSIISR